MIRATSVPHMNGIHVVVIGLEGRGRGKWRTELKPCVDDLDLKLDNVLDGRPSGWYFARLYDFGGDLVESLDFRYVPGLTSITYPDHRIVREQGSDGACHVSIVHSKAVLFRSTGDASELMDMVKTDDGSSLMVPGQAECDASKWQIITEMGNAVDLGIEVQRLWWGLGDDTEAPKTWAQDEVLISRSDLSASSTGALWMRVPSNLRAAKLRLGFSRGRTHDFTPKLNSETIKVPMLGFSDAIERDKPGCHQLSAWLRASDKNEVVPLCRLLVQMVCPHCKHEFETNADAAEHCVTCHVSVFFAHLTYDELAQRIPNLPKKIYKCSYPNCSEFVHATDRSYPESEICQHIDHKHALERKHGGKIEFEVVRSLDEIRQHLRIALPDTYRCRFCPDFLENPGTTLLAKHLITKHPHILFQLK